MSQRDELADEMTGWTVSSGYYGQSLGSEVAQEIAEHLIGAGWVRLRLDDATVERVSQATGWAEHVVRTVLSAAVQEERAMNTDQNLSKEDNSMSNEHSDNCNNPETMCEDCLSTASEDHEAAE